MRRHGVDRSRRRYVLRAARREPSLARRRAVKFADETLLHRHVDRIWIDRVVESGVIALPQTPNLARKKVKPPLSGHDQAGFVVSEFVGLSVDRPHYPSVGRRARRTLSPWTAATSRRPGHRPHASRRGTRRLPQRSARPMAGDPGCKRQRCSPPVRSPTPRGSATAPLPPGCAHTTRRTSQCPADVRRTGTRAGRSPCRDRASSQASTPAPFATGAGGGSRMNGHCHRVASVARIARGCTPTSRSSPASRALSRANASRISRRSRWLAIALSAASRCARIFLSA
jgi:hypothetical protein